MTLSRTWVVLYLPWKRIEMSLVTLEVTRDSKLVVMSRVEVTGSAWVTTRLMPLSWMPGRKGVRPLLATPAGPSLVLRA